MTAPKTRTNKAPKRYEWTRSEALALAQQSCTFCWGLGLRPGRNGATSPCNCVFRAIFRSCYEKFHSVATAGRRISVSSFARNTTRGVGMWGMKDEEFCADFCLVAARVLDTEEHRIFRFHYLLGADWKQCTRKLGMDRGEFFHTCYRIEQKLGRTFAELRPYPLFPVDEYFHCMVERTPRPGFLAECDDDETPAAAATVSARFPVAMRSHA